MSGYRLAILFWAMVAVTFILCVLAYINGGISEFYHPMAAHGDRFFVFRKYAISVPILASIIVFLLWGFRRPLLNKIYIFGLIPLFVAGAMTIFPNIDSEYKQSYWLGDQEHSIPWQYSPFNGQSHHGGTYFLLKVRGLDLTPKYGGLDNEFIIGKSIDAQHDRFKLDKDCAIERQNTFCEWKSGRYYYSIYARTSNFSEDFRPYFQPVVQLLDSFDVNKS